MTKVRHQVYPKGTSRAYRRISAQAQPHPIKEVLRHRFGLGLSLEQIAREDVSQRVLSGTAA
jgi:hypothetical protein